MRRVTGFGFALLSASVSACGGGGGGKAPVAAVPLDAGLAATARAEDAGDATERAEPRDERIARMMKRVTRARGLGALKAVPGVTLARDALIGKVKEHVVRELPPETIRREGLELQLLGFLPSSLDYEAETFKLLEAQLAGFYEPTDGTMYMAADLDGDNAEATLAHELDHALQDQHFDLKPHSKFEPGKSDLQLAFSALAEGDATSTMADVLIARAQAGKTALDLPDEVFVSQVLQAIGSGDAASEPRMMRNSLVAPYVYGTLFVHALRRDGGWDAVNAAWATLPTTSEQILHVEKWRAHEPALAVAAPTFAALGAGWTVSDEDTNGELGLLLGFEEWMEDEEAAAAARNWGGDRMVLLQNGDQAAMAMRLRYDAKVAPLAPNEQPYSLIARSLVKFGKTASKGADWICVERSELGPLGAMKRGLDVIVVAGPAKTAPAWKSSGSCASARKWANEIGATKG